MTEGTTVTRIAHHGAEDAVLMALSDCNALQETLHLLGTAANANHLRRSITGLRANKAKPRQRIDSDGA